MNDPLPASRRVQPAKHRVRIRMYHQGLGDCLLLSFPRPEGSDFHMLVDCGVVLGTGEPGKVMRQVAEDIKAATGGKLDLLVITHEHWDHLSGFDPNQAQDVFDSLEVNALWLAWTEDEQNPTAKRLREEREQKKEAARKAKEAAAKLGLTERAGRMAELLGFFGAQAAGVTSDEGDEGGGTAGALAFLKKKCQPNILETGSHLPLPGVEGVRVYVMGPPVEEADLKKTNPLKGEGFGLGLAPLSLTESFFAAFDPTNPKAEEAQPFPRSVRCSLRKTAPALRCYYADEQAWRRIDDAWLATGERLALQLDNATNNTSLVLALELEPSRDVLLLVGDAQAGNWRSWENWKWRVREQGTARTVTAADLLRQTIFYKVGHHGSHNATLKDKGLELMTSDRLAAFIPVDTRVAHEVKRWMHMPLPAIRERLEEKCAIVFQSDEKPKEIRSVPGTRFERAKQTFPVRMKNASKKAMETVRNQSLYTDYFV
ncbi:MAG TPA: MBL fold metallo-hydrolase [Verrucomicrobiota bacterium]|nr:MBL fold metallo-hydrolase [Verrucomicrobiota bacterium]